MSYCPGCNVAIGRFRVTADTGEHIGTITCRRTGASYTPQQDIPQHPPPAGSKACKRRKSRRPIVIAERRAARRYAADAKTQDRKARKVQRRAEAAA
jgi:hypothetical protein